MTKTLALQSVGMILRELVRHPIRYFVHGWNWKSAVLSSTIRSTLFFAVNAGAGLEAARSAFVTELVFRATTAGFYGSITQAFRSAQPPWPGTLAAMLLLPAAAHLLEGVVHRMRGTAELAASIGASVALTVVSTAFNLFAMRRGALIVGQGSRSLWSDLRRTPSLLLAFVGHGCSTLGRLTTLAVEATERRLVRRCTRPGNCSLDRS
jgi:hypothetical protein